MKLFAVEGNRQRLDGGAMFGNAPREVWKNWCAPDEKNRIDLACRTLLIETDAGQKILCETGIGDFFSPKLKERFGVFENGHQLLINLKKIGVEPSDIDAVVLSHLHFDHAGGLLSSFSTEDPSLVFPRAQFYVGAKHWERANDPIDRDRASFIVVLNELLEKSGRLRLVTDQTPPELAHILQFRFSEGHTVGLMHAVIHHPKGHVFFAADLIPGLAWVHLPITMGYDRFPEKLMQEKREFLNDVIKQDGFLFLTHDPKVAVAKVHQDETGRYIGEESSLLD